MRVLMASTRGAGHFFPLVPFAAALARRGHDVLFAGPPELAGSAAAEAFAFWPFADPPADELGAVWSRVPSMSHEEANFAVLAEIFGRLNTTAALPRLREACSTWRPDIVVRDPAMFGAALAAEGSGIPHARVAIGLASTEEMSLRTAASTIDTLRGDAGLAPDPDAETLRGSPYLTFWPSSLEDPACDGQPKTARFHDPRAETAVSALPDWWDGDDAPLVYVTFGSVAGGYPMGAGAYPAAVEAAAGLPARVLFTVGHGADLDALPPAPPNLRVERWVPQADVLREAAAVVCHGGSGSTLGALAAGVPLVVVPLFADQPLNAARVAAVGAGIAVKPPSAAGIRDGVLAALADPEYRAQAGRLAQEIRSHPPVDDAVAYLEQRAGIQP